MPYDNESGFTPSDFDTVYQQILDEHNAEVFTKEITKQEFDGSAEGKVAYANAQSLINLEIVFSQCYERLRNFVRNSNLKIQTGGVAYFPLLASIENATGLPVSIAQATDARRGLYIAIDYDDSTADDELRQTIANSIFRNQGAGIATYGDIAKQVPIKDSQPANIKWSQAMHLDESGNPVAGKGELNFKLTITTSRNSSAAVDDTETVINKFLANFDSLAKIGKDIEPESYFEIVRDAPYAANISCQYQLDDGSWTDAIKQVDYNEAYAAKLNTSNVIFN